MDVPPPSSANDSDPMPRARWTARLSRAKRWIVAVAGVGAVLSGLAGWWNTYSTVRNVSTAASKSVPASSVTAASAAVAPLSVAVMPFANQTGDAQKAYIADGLTSGLTSDLARIQDAYVVPAVTAYGLRDKGLTVQQLGQSLGVGYVLTGSVVSGGDRLRITAQLTDARTGAQAWSRSFDGEMGDLIALQDQVTTETANSTGNAMVLIASQRSEKQRGNPTAMDLRLRARALGLQPQSEERFKSELALLRQALALEQDNPDIKLDLATNLWLLARNWENGPAYVDDRKRHYAEARAFATQAAAALPDNVRACRLMGQFSRMDGEIDAARSLLDHCLTSNPRSAVLLSDMAALTMYDGVDGAHRAVDLLQKAIAIRGTHVNEIDEMNLGEALFTAGDDAGAITHLQLALRANPRVVESYWYLAMAYADLGDMAHVEEIKARIASPKEFAHDLQGVGFKDFEQNNSVPTAGYRVIRETRFLRLWRKAGLQA